MKKLLLSEYSTHQRAAAWPALAHPPRAAHCTVTRPSPTPKPSPAANTVSNGLPTPTLFMNSPSRNASTLSVSQHQTAQASVDIKKHPIGRHQPALSRFRDETDNFYSAGAEDDGDNSLQVSAVVVLFLRLARLRQSQ
ncbi:hypothetical protein Slin15195_G129400 [Septoria linicola]|uniref:Uncharacterized protein n=1 Tax=Septoria linicola TaxID=215465 RepID=A0A9Q9BB02_9PEZI|nr:hypothetical protein Slin15195_G129400 [Septoria linicola]